MHTLAVEPSIPLWGGLLALLVVLSLVNLVLLRRREQRRRANPDSERPS